MNVYSVPPAGGGTATVIVDLAHNEAGLEALLRVAEGLRPPGAVVHLGLGTGGDRTDEILQALGELAGRRADRVTAVHKEHYLRGRSMDDLEAQLRIGLGRVGVGEVESYPSELGGLQAMVATAGDGDVLAVMCHADRALLHAWLTGHGGTVDCAATIRRKVIAARGEHEAEEAIAALRAEPDPAVRVQQARTWWEADRRDARLAFELAGALDAAGQEREALRCYDEALALGLREPHRHRALIQKASSLRRLGQLDEAAALLDDLARQRPGSAAVAAFRALVRCDAGDPVRAVGELVEALLAHAGDADDDAYRDVLHRFARELR